MAAQLPGRSDNEIKNHWHTHLKNRIRKDKIEQVGSHENTSKGNPKGCREERTDLESQEEVGVLLKVLSSGMSSSTTSEQSQNWLSDSGYSVSNNVRPRFVDYGDSFWTAPFLLDNDEVVSSTDYTFSPMFFR